MEKFVEKDAELRARLDLEAKCRAAKGDKRTDEPLAVHCQALTQKQLLQGGAGAGKKDAKTKA